MSNLTQPVTADSNTAGQAPDPRAIQRVRHDTRRRILTVTAAEALTPGIRRISFHSDELCDFVSLSPDDHVKIMLPGADGDTIMRDYTPRAFDARAGLLVIDFALHEAGPVTAWAIAARPGDTLQIGGPRGSAIIPWTFDWYLLIGDETALPAIGRRLEEAPAGAPVTTLCVVDTKSDIQAIATPARWTAEWICRDVAGVDDATNLRAAVDRLISAKGDGFVWIAGEAQVARRLRAHLLDDHAHPLRWMKAAGYWVRGEAGAPSSLD